MLVNLDSTSAASVFATSPRPGVTGTLPVARGGTGVTTIDDLKETLGLTNSLTVNTERIGYWCADSDTYNNFVGEYFVNTESYYDYNLLDKYFAIVVKGNLNVTNASTNSHFYITLGWSQPSYIYPDYTGASSYNYFKGSRIYFGELTDTGEFTYSYLFTKTVGSAKTHRGFQFTDTDDSVLYALYYPQYYSNYNKNYYQYPMLYIPDYGSSTATVSFEIELVGLYF